MTYIDSHAHLSGETAYPEVDGMVERALKANVTKIVNICTDAASLEKGLLLSRKYPFIYNTASTTPHDVAIEGEALFPLMEKHARAGDLVAIGETGLDYHRHLDSKKVQIDFLKRYLHLAAECNLPVVIHCRDAFSDFFEILDAEYPKNQTGVLHCFTGTIEEAKEVIKRGWTLSLSGIVTFKKSEELREVAKLVPLNQLLIETDTPYLAPQKMRGKMNEPSFVVETAAVIADVRGISLEELSFATSENAKKLFRLG